MSYSIESELYHYGTKRHSGRYRWGSGDNPYQHEEWFIDRVDKIKSSGVTDDKEIAKAMGMSYSEYVDMTDESFLVRVDRYRKQGMTNNTDIAKAMGMSTTVFRQKTTIANEKRDAAIVSEAVRLMNEQGMSRSAVARKLGIPDNTLKDKLRRYDQRETTSTANVADALRERADKYGYIDVGRGAESYLNVSRVKLDTALKRLKDEGYLVQETYIKQMTSDNLTTLKVLTPGNISQSDVHKNKDQIKMVTDIVFEDNGLTSRGLRKPTSIDSKRIYIRYGDGEGDENGTLRDGVIELRRNVEDLSLGKSRYAQVRIAVDESMYLKGMAIYSDTIPKGYDVVFNTNKPKGTPMEKVFKPMKDDPDNPFGSSIMKSGINNDTGLLAGGQYEYVGKDGKKHLSAINKVNEEGSWDGWSRTLSSQFLSKQSLTLAKNQLNLDYTSRAENYESLKEIVNPVVRKKMLTEFADECDAAAGHLKAAALPRQASQVLLPCPGLKENEIYAPNYKNGETVVLIRHPHAGPFEIPQLKVNNNAKAAKDVFEHKDYTAPMRDAVAVNPKVAEQLSGADFDGDTVLVIPNPKVNSKERLIKVAKPLKDLEDFDPKACYPAYEGMKEVKKDTAFRKNMQMGIVSNLITDMTLHGANEHEIARAVKHSMVVIDAEKHNLNWRQSEKDNGIAELKKKYQGKASGGASTIISRASGEANYDGVRTEGVFVTDPATGKSKKMYIDPNTGKKLYTIKTETWVDKEGKEHTKTTKTTRMEKTDDAFTLVTGGSKQTAYPMEVLYANYANSLKTLANQARKDTLSIETPHVSKEAKATYAKEVSSLSAKLNVAKKNQPLERQALIIANYNYAEKVRANPDMDKDDKKKLRSQEMAGARLKTKSVSKNERIEITDKEWEAINANALPATTVSDILKNSNPDRVKELATPRAHSTMTPGKIARAKAMANSSYTIAEIAQALGVSASTVRKYIYE